MSEVWKDISGYEGLYQVSDLGNVKSLDRISVSSDNKVRNLKGLMLKQPLNVNGIPYVTLSKNGKRQKHTTHKIVALTFIGERPEGYQVLHRDGDCLNNKLCNLSYDTQSQNMIDMYRYGKKNGSGKLTIEQVLEIRKLFKTGKYTKVKLGRMFKVSDVNIYEIVTKKTYQWLNDDGTIDDSDTAVS
ncbi:MAG TPA: HNH endonuclease [Candidatus Coprovivens excrementavium]|nr:HNH endonuclease [Candidatus Coprovivens excrementavium]